MGNGEPSNSVQLFYMGDESGVQSVTASVTQEGDLTLESWDYGSAVSDALGSDMREWEHICTVRSADVPAVRDALGGEGGEDVLSLLSQQLDQESCRRPSAWLKHHDIPFDQWSWTTD